MGVEIHIFWLFVGPVLVSVVSFMLGNVIGYENATRDVIEDIQGLELDE